MNMYNEAQAMKEALIAHRRYLHQNPETGLDLPLTSAYVEEQLKKMGYEPQRVGSSGLVVTVGKGGGKTFLLRADMDALPVTEQADIDFKSTNGNMHACGHDIHTTSLLGAAQLLKAHEDEIEGTVKLMFQPAEETMDGGKMMVEAGICEGVDAAMAMHVGTAVEQPVGSIAVVHHGSVSAAVDWFEIHVTGKGCHGAMPHLGIDPINVSAHIITALQGINARNLDPADNLVLTIGQIHSGNTGNVIPNEAMMSGTIRTLKNETRAMVKARMEKLVKSIGDSFEADAKVVWGSGCPVLTRDAEVNAQVLTYLKGLEGMNVVDLTGAGANKGMASEDFAYVANEVPSTMVSLYVGRPSEGYVRPLHHPMAKFNEDALPCGAAAYAHVAMEWLKNNK